MPLKSGRLLAVHTNFRRLWIAQTISQFGTQVSALAVPLIAATVLRASPLQVSALFALQYLPYVLIGLPAGVWIDRLRRRRVMIAADLVRFVAMLIIPAAMTAGRLGLPLLYGVVVSAGAATVFFEVAYQAYLPSVVDRDRLLEANGWLAASRSVAAAAGPTAGGAIVAAVTAPFAVVVDAVSYLCSAAFVVAMRVSETAARPPVGRSIRREMGEGIRLVVGDRLLWTLTWYSAASSLCVSMVVAIDVVFLVRSVHLSSSGVGLLWGVASLGPVAGVLIVPVVRRRYGEVFTLVGAALSASLSLLLISLTEPGWRLAFFVAGSGLASAAIVGYNVVSVALMQRRCPDHLLGRMFATSRFLTWSTPPLGALLGGALGTTIGLRAAITSGAALFVVTAAALAWALRHGDPGAADRGAHPASRPDKPVRRSPEPVPRRQAGTLAPP